MAKIPDPDKYVDTVYDVRFDSHSEEFSLPDSSVGKNVIIFGVDISSSVFINNKIKDILILGKGPAQGLDDTRFTAEAQYSLDFSRSNKNVPLSLHYNGSTSFFFVDATKIYQFKAKSSEIKKISLVFREYLKNDSYFNLKNAYQIDN